MQPAPRVRVFLLGQFAVEVDGALVPAQRWTRRRPVELLTAVALASGHAVHKEEVIDLLWPDKDLTAGANNLYRTLHELRKILGDDAIAMERGAVRLSSATWVDVTEFERGVAAGDPESLQAAVDLYTGDLLPDDPYADRLASRREYLRQRFVDAGTRLAERFADAPQRQIDVLRRLVAVDATLESAHRGLMNAMAAAGRKADALKQYGECVMALRQVLDVAPSQQTQLLKQTIETGSYAPKSTQTVDWTRVSRRLVGRERPGAVHGRDEAAKTMKAFVQGGRGVCTILGEAGVGKSRLAVEGARLARDEGAVLMAGIGDHFEGTAPYTPFVDAWADFLRQGTQPESDNPFLAFKPVPGASAQEDRLRLYQAIEAAIAAIAGDGSLYLVIEDLHWADESSLQLFHHLARATANLPLLLVGTFRGEEAEIGSPVRALTSALRRERLGSRIELERLDRTATERLIADILGEEPQAWISDSVFGLAAGNPFFTEEVVRAISDGGLENGTEGLPEDLLDTVRQRVHRLGLDAERLLVMASAIGERFDFEVAQSAMDADAESALGALERGLQAQVIEDVGEGIYRFRHALTRSALYSALTHARRVFMHRRIAKGIESLAAHKRVQLVEALAHHHSEGGQLEEALPHLALAAERARARLGFEESVKFSSQALEVMDTLGTPDGPDRFAILSARGGMRVALGELGTAVEDLDQCAAMRTADWAPSNTEHARVLRMASLALIESGDLEGAERRLEAATEKLQDDDAELSNVLYQFSQLRWHQSRHQDSYALAERCLAVAERHDDTQAVAKGFEMLALACHSLGEWNEGRQHEQKRHELADGTLDVASAFDVHL